MCPSAKGRNLQRHVIDGFGADLKPQPAISSVLKDRELASPKGRLMCDRRKASLPSWMGLSHILTWYRIPYLACVGFHHFPALTFFRDHYYHSFVYTKLILKSNGIKQMPKSWRTSYRHFHYRNNITG